MTTARNDFDDAATATLLRKQGDARERAVGAKPLDPPADLGAVVQRDRVRLSRVRVVLALAAAIALGVGGWWVAHRLGWMGSAPSKQRDYALGEIALSSTPTLIRGDAGREFRSGDPLYVHLRADKAGTAFVAMLDARLGFVPVTPATLALDKGANTLGPFTLDDSVGTESIVILATEEPLAPAAFEQMVKRTASAVERGPTLHSERLRDIRVSLGDHVDLAVQTATFEHEPR